MHPPNSPHVRKQVIVDSDVGGDDDGDDAHTRARSQKGETPSDVKQLIKN